MPMQDLQWQSSSLIGCVRRRVQWLCCRLRGSRLQHPAWLHARLQVMGTARFEAPLGRLV
jgi:hypothetical protein